MGVWLGTYLLSLTSVSRTLLFFFLLYFLSFEFLSRSYFSVIFSTSSSNYLHFERAIS